MNPLKAVKGRLFTGKTYDEAQELIRLFIDAGCMVCISTEEETGTYRLQTYSYTPRPTGKLTKEEA
jgi:hypothetical protein